MLELKKEIKRKQVELGSENATTTISNFSENQPRNMTVFIMEPVVRNWTL